MQCAEIYVQETFRPGRNPVAFQEMFKHLHQLSSSSLWKVGLT